LTDIEVRIDTKTNKVNVEISGAGSMDSTTDPELPVVETLIIDWNVPEDAANRTTPIIGATMPGVEPEAEGEETASPDTEPEPTA
jgi:hypothetical protein